MSKITLYSKWETFLVVLRTDVLKVITSKVMAKYLCSYLIMKEWMTNFTTMRNIAYFDRKLPLKIKEIISTRRNLIRPPLLFSDGSSYVSIFSHSNRISERKL